MNTGEIKRIWSKIDLGERIHPYEETMFPAFLRVAKESDRILEVGVGRGRMARILKANGVDADFCCLDLLVECTTNIPEDRVAGDARKLPFCDHTFDLTYSLGVIEHFPETLDALREHARVTKRNGYILITTPHLSPATLIRLLVFHFKLRKEHHTSFEVLLGRNISLKNIRQYCNEAGLEIVQLSASGPIIPAANPLVQKLTAMIPLPTDKFGAYLWCLARKTRLDASSA
jgi:ubiquinone/menaquinone biosynthesis C-methylase UbiE